MALVAVPEQALISDTQTVTGAVAGGLIIGD